MTSANDVEWRGGPRKRLLWAIVLAVAAVMVLPGGVWAADAFTDVAQDNVHHDAVGAVRDAGVTEGCAEARYCPGATVRRDQMASFMDRLGALSGQTPVVNAATAEHAADSAALGGTAAQELLDRLQALETQLSDATARIVTLEADNAQLQATLAGVTRTSDAAGRDTMTLTGMNLQLVDGTGITDGDPNGLGNLIIGYNALRSNGDTDPEDRLGSHYLVVGDGHHWTRSGGILAGRDNTASGSYASVLGGTWNTASGPWASVSGGFQNTASGVYDSVAGGLANTASGVSASVAGGTFNTASGSSASVAGGDGNTASGSHASILGGLENTVDTENACHPGC